MELDMRTPEEYQQDTRLMNINARFAKYGITADQYYALVKKQHGRCAICKTHTPAPRKMWSIDHDHACCPGSYSCGKCVRGLVCNNCNVVLGMAHDSIETLEAAVEYLKVAATKQ